MQKKSRVRKPQVTILPEKHSILREVAKNRRTKIETVTDEALELGMRMKRWLPSQSQDPGTV
jgi:hypothetical protein